MIFSIPIIAIVSDHFEKAKKIQLKMIESELELEKIKQENYKIETEKLRLELKKLDSEQNDITKFLE